MAEGVSEELLPSVESMTRLLFSPDAEIIAIGDPSTRIGAPPENKFYDGRARCDYWLPFYISTENDVGTQFQVNDEAWAPYGRLISGWRWIATGETPSRYPDPSHYLLPVTRHGHGVQVAVAPIATTRYEKLIAMRIHLAAVAYTRTVGRYSDQPDPSSGQVVARSSPVFWLPKPDRVSAEESIDTILRERFGIALVTRVPDWASSYSLPDEAPIAESISTLERERSDLEHRISEVRAAANSAAKPRLLLYEKGREALEPVVREVLRELGSRVEEPEANGIEDGMLFCQYGSAVLEIKGRTGPIKQDDVRQVVQWAGDARLRDGVEYKPLIVGNAHCETPLEERGAPLAPNAERYAINGSVAVVTTAQLFEALRRKQAGSFDEATFWKTVFESNGLARLPQPDTAANGAT
jgi:hypothetical protein